MTRRNNPSAAARRPLDGVTVVSLEQAVAAPYCTRQLADLGARVIKVERPGVGDFARGYDETVRGEASYFVWANRSKESLTLDIKSPEGRAVLGELIASADVFVQNLAPGATRRIGLDADTLAELHPRLIVCDISGWGSDGPWADRKAYDLLVQCETGLLSLTGTPEEAAKVGVSIADIAAGMYAYTGVLTALYQRAVTGVVSPVEVSLFEALAEWVGQPAYFTKYGGKQPPRSGAKHPTIAPYGPFPTGDGGTVLLSVQNEREWAGLCTHLLGDASIAKDERYDRNAARVAHREEVDGMVADALARLTADEAREVLDTAKVANARVNSVHGLLDHPVLAARGRWVPTGTPGGTVETLLPPAMLRGVPARTDPVPALGSHTDAILRSLGRTEEDIARHRRDGVV